MPAPPTARPSSCDRKSGAGSVVETVADGLTGVQKQLLRMGPRNVRIIQSSLREIALALGIPAERLPVPAT